jgi:chorismate synthase
LGIQVFSHVIQLGGVSVPPNVFEEDYADLAARVETNDFRCCADEPTLLAMKHAVDSALQEGVTLGGTLEIVALNVPPGLGTYVQWDRKLDGKIAQALMSIQAVKAVSLGLGAQGGELPGSEFHDAIVPGAQEQTLTRPTNRAGGLEGGMTNGMPVVARAVMKPIATMRKALPSINIETGEPQSAHFERSDITAVPACGVICEAMLCIVLVQAILDKFGHDSFLEIQRAMQAYRQQLRPAILN